MYSPWQFELMEQCSINRRFSYIFENRHLINGPILDPMARILSMARIVSTTGHRTLQFIQRTVHLDRSSADRSVAEQKPRHSAANYRAKHYLTSPSEVCIANASL